MSDKLTAIKIKQPDGTYSDQILISVLAENVRYDSTKGLIDQLNYLDGRISNIIAASSGSVSTQLDQDLVDIKVGNDGVTYNTPGDAVRANDQKALNTVLVQSSQPTAAQNKLWIQQTNNDEIEILTMDDLTNVVTAQYDNQGTYAIGDYVLHEGGFYRCKVAIDTAENWTAGHWTPVKIAKEVTDLKSAVYKYTGNLLDFGHIGGTWEQGSIGNENPYQCKTGKINVIPGNTIYGVTSNILKEQTPALSGYTMALHGVFFTSNDEQIIDKNFSNTNGEVTESYTIPSNCAYCIAFLTSGSWNNQFTPSTLDNAVPFAYLGYDNIAASDIIPNYVTYPVYNDENIEAVKTLVEQESELVTELMYKYTGNMLDFGYFGGTWVQAALDGSTDTYTCVTKPIPIEANETVYGVINASKYNESFSLPQIILFVGAYDENGTLLGQKNMSNNSGQVTNFYTTPTGTTYIKGCLSTKTWGTNLSPSELDNAVPFAYLGFDEISYQDVMPNYIPYTKYLDGEVNKIESTIKSHWNEKKIVWFGTSIPAGVVNAGDTGGNGAYPTRIGDILGATVYNESIGSSRVRAGSHKHITEDDPMGWSGIDAAVGVMLSLSLSQAEKQSIIDNWDTKWKNIMNNPSSYNPNNTSAYLAASWDAKLTKYLSGGSVGQCDLYVFDHGYNDGVVTYGFSELDEMPENSTDRTYWYGAMNFIIKKILEDNPKAHILFIGHYSKTDDPFNRGATWSYKYVCEAQEKYATMWGFDCVPTWNLLGLSTQTIMVDGIEKPIIEVRYPDKLHPASDSTGLELKRYAEALAPYVNLAR